MKPKRGVCQFCGCTPARACPGGCWWINEQHTVCSSKPCVDKHFSAMTKSFAGLMSSIRAGER